MFRRRACHFATAAPFRSRVRSPASSQSRRTGEASSRSPDTRTESFSSSVISPICEVHIAPYHKTSKDVTGLLEEVGLHQFGNHGPASEVRLHEHGTSVKYHLFALPLRLSLVNVVQQLVMKVPTLMRFSSLPLRQ